MLIFKGGPFFTSTWKGLINPRLLPSHPLVRRVQTAHPTHRLPRCEVFLSGDFLTPYPPLPFHASPFRLFLPPFLRRKILLRLVIPDKMKSLCLLPLLYLAAITARRPPLMPQRRLCAGTRRDGYSPLFSPSRWSELPFSFSSCGSLSSFLGDEIVTVFRASPPPGHI